VDWIKQHLGIILLCGPVLFFLLNSGIKWLLGHLNVHFLGADAALCGCSLFYGTFLRKLSTAGLGSGNDASAAVVCLVVSIVAWFVLVILGNRKNPIISFVAAGAGSASLYLCAVAAWSIH
jgi:hypothetical protein